MNLKLIGERLPKLSPMTRKCAENTHVNEIKQASALVNAIIRNNCTFECGICAELSEFRTKSKLFVAEVSKTCAEAKILGERKATAIVLIKKLCLKNTLI